jgi:hypothetical protein
VPLTINKPPQTEAETAKLAKSPLLPDGTYAAHIREARDDKSKRSGRDMIVLTIVVLDAEGNERILLVYLHTASAALLLLRHACISVGAEAEFSAGRITPELFPGHDVRVIIGTEKKGKWPARNVVLDMLPADGSAVAVPGTVPGTVTPLVRIAS